MNANRSAVCTALQITAGIRPFALKGENYKESDRVHYVCAIMQNRVAMVKLLVKLLQSYQKRTGLVCPSANLDNVLMASVDIESGALSEDVSFTFEDLEYLDQFDNEGEYFG